MSKRIVGTCGNCGGTVTVPAVWYGINPPVPTCDHCCATVCQPHGRVLPMNPPRVPTKGFPPVLAADLVVYGPNGPWTDRDPGDEQ